MANRVAVLFNCFFAFLCCSSNKALEEKEKEKERESGLQCWLGGRPLCEHVVPFPLPADNPLPCPLATSLIFPFSFFTVLFPMFAKMDQKPEVFVFVCLGGLFVFNFNADKQNNSNFGNKNKKRFHSYSLYYKIVWYFFFPSLTLDFFDNLLALHLLFRIETLDDNHSVTAYPVYPVCQRPFCTHMFLFCDHLFFFVYLCCGGW